MFDSLFKQFAAIEPIDWLAMITGITGVYLSIRERLSAWPLFIVCYCAYVYISIRTGYYALSALSAISVVIAIYGWHKWSGTTNVDNHILRISKAPSKFWPFIFIFIALFTVTVGTLLSQTDAARLPFVDAFAMSNALAAQWMLSRKHIENWIFWILSDTVYVALFLNDRLWPSVLLFGAFILLACKGWREWKRSIAQANTCTLP